VKQKVALKEKETRTQINGKLNGISSADEKQNITIEPLFKNCTHAVRTFIHR
jgi:hypothetical protein